MVLCVSVPVHRIGVVFFVRGFGIYQGVCGNIISSRCVYAIFFLFSIVGYLIPWCSVPFTHMCVVDVGRSFSVTSEGGGIAIVNDAPNNSRVL